MSTVDVLTGLRTGRFDRLRVKNPVTGEYEEILPTNANQLLQVYVGGVLYPASGLSFANAYSMFDPVTSTLQIGGPLYQGFVRIGDSATYSDLSRGAAGQLLWDGGAMASEALVTQLQTDLQINLDGTVAYVQGNFWPRSEQPLDVYVNGSLVSQASGLNFSNHSNSLDPNTGILTLGPVLSQTLLRLGTNAVYGDLTRGSGGELLWDGAAMQSALNGGSDVALNVGRGVMMLENNQYDNAVGAGVTLRALVNPSTTGSMLAVRSSGGACRFWVGQGITTTGLNDFHCCGNSIAGLEHDPAGYRHSFTNSQVTIGTPLVVNGPLTTQHYTESSSATTTIAQGQDTLTPISLHIAWGSEGGAYTNVAGSHQELTLPHLGIGYFSNHPAGTKVYLSVDLKAGSLTEVVFAVHDGGVYFDTITFQGLSSTTWTTYTWSFSVTEVGAFVFGVGRIPSNLGVDRNYTNQNSGTILIRNLHLYTTADAATISAPLTCEKDVTFNTSIEAQHARIFSITAAQYFSSSDERIKTSIQDASLEACQQVFDAVQVKTYERTDLAGKRIGFIAQDIEASSPEEFANLHGTRPGGETADAPLLTIDYSRLVCVLWGVVKTLTSRIEALEAKLP
jgi:hypothetical protein